MFSGIVEGIGSVAAVAPGPSGLRLEIATPLSGSLVAGDSVAVNGVCLTVVAQRSDRFEADVGPETARVTTLGGLEAGARVNLERAVPLGGRLGGHLVQGHVDGVGAIAAVRPEAGSVWLTVAFPQELAPLFIRKGSVAVDGVSLTVAELDTERLAIQVIPFTAGATTLGERRPGDQVNLECDMIGKYIVRVAELARTSHD
jgi:riboflavin synthase